MKLNERQREAVEHHDGPVLIVAGAGTGKTRTITCRIASLINSGVPPQKILAITFTNKASQEMRDRVGRLLRAKRVAESLRAPEEKPFISTFHSLGVHILRRCFKEAGLQKNFSIADRDRSKQMVKEASRRLGFDGKTIEPSKVLALISRQKNSLISWADHDDKDVRMDGFVELWREYERILKEESSVDFDDLLIKPLEILESYRQVREFYQSRWSHIHIDEFQDTNEAQIRLSDVLAQKHKNICATGDLDQCIYSWRGAKVDAMLDFESRYPNVKTFVLEKNYRSTKTILDAANRVISLNRRRKEKNLFTGNNEGEKIEYSVSGSETGEAVSVADKVQKLLSGGVPASDIAVLYRTNFQSRALEEAFLADGIPYSVIGVKFLQRQEVRDTLAYLEASLNSKSKSSLARIINIPTRGIGKVTLLKVLEGEEDRLPQKTKDKVVSFKKILRRIKDKSEELVPSELLRFVLEESGLASSYKKRNEEERLDNVKELVTLASRYDELGPREGLSSFMEHVALFSEQDAIPTDERRSVRLMTVHAAKGLEFKYVFITGLEEGLFPHEPKSDESRDEEEERRLFYVALTRARVKAYLSSAYIRTIFGATSVRTPSRFITDIGEENISSENGFLEEELSSGLLSGPPLPPIY